MAKTKKLEAEFIQDPSVEDIALDTLAGDVRDVLLTRVRNMTIPWGHLNEQEQKDINYAMDACAKDLVRKTVALLTQAKFPSILVSVGVVKIDKGVEVKLAVSETVENIVALAQHGKGSAVLVLAEASAYFGERGPAPVDKDQPPLPGTDEED